MELGITLGILWTITVCTANEAGGGTPFTCPGLGLEIVTREQWGAQPPKAVTKIPSPINMTFIHHTAGLWQCDDLESCSWMMRDIQDFHQNDRGWNDIGYNFVMGEDGRVYVGRGWEVEGAHTRGYNTIGNGFCIIGNYMERLPDAKAMEATQKIIQCGVNNGFVGQEYELFGHRDGGCTACPGDMLYEEIKSWPHFSNRTIPKYCK